jgi:hypothetical protein
MASDTFRVGAPEFDDQKKMRKRTLKAKAYCRRDFIIVDPGHRR